MSYCLRHDTQSIYDVEKYGDFLVKSDMIHRAYKTELDVNNSQQTLLLQHIGCARWAYNWALNKKKEAFDKKEKIPNHMDLHKELVRLKQSDISWMYNSSKAAPQNALIDCDQAFQNFFIRCKKQIKGSKGFPKFKSKRNPKQSFKLNGSIRVESDRIKLPRIGWLKFFEIDYIPTDHKIISATISRMAGKWFVSLNTESPNKPITPPASIEVLGVDLGIKNLATCSDGTVYGNIKALSSNLERLKRKQRQFSRKQKGSKNKAKAKLKLVKIHYQISNIRKDSLHKITSKIVHENQVIVLEDLNVKGMMSNRSLAKAISDVGMGEFRRQIEYKAKWYGRTVCFADRFYPSSKLCSVCGWKHPNLTLSDRVYECDGCGQVSDRDMNAAINLRQFYTAGLAGINASGDGSSPLSARTSVSLSLKEESNMKHNGSTL